MSNDIASGMDAILKDPEYKSMFSSSAVLEKLAFTRVADEDKPTEIEVEFAGEIGEESSLEVTASDNARADCVACGKKRSGWSEKDGVCKCASKDGCSPMGGCKEGCSCGCKAKKAGVVMDTLIKSAFDSLMKASSDLDAAGFESLSANTLILMNDLIVEAKKKKMTKEERAAAKEKADAAKAKMKAKLEKEKAKAKAEKDKNDARDKASKAKARAEDEKVAKKKKQEAEKSKK